MAAAEEKLVVVAFVTLLARTRTPSFHANVEKSDEVGKVAVADEDNQAAEVHRGIVGGCTYESTARSGGHKATGE